MKTTTHLQHNSSNLLFFRKRLVQAFLANEWVGNGKAVETFSSVTETFIETTSMVEAVNIAYHIANPKDSVLLSPACSSLDLFKNYEDRGNQFKEAVRKL